MARAIDFYFDYSCPYAYLGFTQIERLTKQTGATLTLKPMLLGGVFRANDTPQKLFATLSPQKAKHNGEDMDRWAKAFGVSLTMPNAHPFRTVEALRATIACGIDPKVIAGFYRAYWVDNRPVSDEQTMRDVLSAAGHDPLKILAQIGSEEIKADLFRRTDEAIAHGIFGAPALVVDDPNEPGQPGGQKFYWGQDRLHFALGIKMEDVFEKPGSHREQETKAKKEDAMHTLEYFWDFSSPFAYLANTQIEAVAKRTGAKLVSRPMFLGGLFRAIGQADVPLMTWSEAKRSYMFQDIKRWADYWNVPFGWPTRFPMNSIKALRAHAVMPEARRSDFRAKTFAAYWAEDKDIGDESVLKTLIGDDADEILKKTQDPAIKEQLVAGTKYAEQKGVFGAPAFIVDEKDLFWGQDRIVLVERALTA